VGTVSALLIATAGALSPAGAPAAAGAPVVINLVTINDFHGRIERAAPAAGAAALAGAVNQIRAANPNTVFAAAGDLIGASTFTSFIQHDNPTIDALNAAGLQVSAVGNHEFDQGYADLMNHVLPRANWEYIGANVHTNNGDPNLPEYWTITMQGVTVGFVGAVTAELPALVSPAGIANLTIEQPVVAANRVADQLSDGNPANGEADMVVLLVHEGAATTAIESATDPTSPFGKIVLGADDNIDAIVSGHTHLAYNHVIDGRPVISSGQYGEKFSNMTIQIDPDTKQILSMNNVVIDAFNIAPPVVPDPTVAAIVAQAVADAAGPGAQPLGSVTADFNRAFTALRGAESTLGNFVADVQLWSANSDAPDVPAQIAFMNPGGLRTDIKFAPDGVVTYKEAAEVQPFANTLNTFTLTGAQIKTVLEQQWQPAGSSRPFLKLGINQEFHYLFDPTRPLGDRITQMTLNGVGLDPAGAYRVVANSFLAAGGDNFFELARGTAKVDTGKIDLQSMVDWFAEFGTATPDYQQRSFAAHVSAPNADGSYDQGDVLTIDLKALDFTTTEPKSGTVTATIGGVALGSAPVDPTFVPLFDETGRATISAPIPAGVYGDVDLTITVPSTGTTASVPIHVRAATTTSASTNTPVAQRGSTVIVRASVDSALPTNGNGTYTVSVDGAELGTFAYVENDEGEVKIKLPKDLAEGTHEVVVSYSGTADLTPSSASVTVTIVKGRVGRL
jgi:5'-nucleotidase